MTFNIEMCLFDIFPIVNWGLLRHYLFHLFDKPDFVYDDNQTGVELVKAMY